MGYRWDIMERAALDHVARRHATLIVTWIVMRRVVPVVLVLAAAAGAIFYTVKAVHAALLWPMLVPVLVAAGVIVVGALAWRAWGWRVEHLVPGSHPAALVVGTCALTVGAGAALAMWWPL